MTIEPGMVILYVDNAAGSAAFYEKLLGRPPIESSPTFAMFKLNAATLLGLWSRGGVEPRATAAAGSGELGIRMESAGEVESLCRAWRDSGTPIVQEPVMMDFGFTCVGVDPDGHRLRIFAPNPGE